ncbi:unnamed protein product [Heligmosomoides polygyrus]|uniref:CAP_C domain-containing protein n=1 Tax=Heligmosomoides polygyrus TaxID=6339 RepID=A0A183FHS4_HELPZ|nr:unnamed protein product [Heligmosomoides polygyrus]
MSIATSTEDESNFELDVVPEDDDLFLADIAEDATTVDDNIINDKIYRALMAKKGNILVADLESVLVVGNSHNKDLLVRGKVDSVTLSHRLNVARSEVYGIHRIKNSTESVAQASDSQVTFCVNAPDQSSVVEVEVDVKDLSAQLDDEVLAHLSAFVVDDDKPKNKVRLRVNVSNSNIEIDIAGASYVYSSLILIPDCSRQEHHLSRQQREEVVTKLSAKPPLGHPIYECSLEEQAGKYLDVPLKEKERRKCPSGLICLDYWSYNLGSEYSDILDAAVTTWDFYKNLTAIGRAAQFGCNFSENDLTQEIACFFKPFEP